MAATIAWFGKGAQAMMAGSIDLDTDTFKLMLASSSYTPNRDTHDFRDDVTNEVTGTNWAAGGITLSGAALSFDATSDQARWDLTDVSNATTTIASARYGIIYKSRGGASTADELLALIDFGGDQSVTAATFAITWHADGVLYIDVT
jgi:hypothetical protein